MNYLLSLFMGLIISIVLTKPILRLVKEGGLSVTNYRQQEVPIALGIAIMGCIIVQVIIYHVLNIEILDYKLLFIYLGVFIIGLLDDVLEDKDNKGFKGHFKALAKGKITTGFLKAVGIPFLLFLFFSWDNYIIIIDLFFIALTVNLFNFLDLRPGRCQKVFILTNLVIYQLVDYFATFNLGIIGIVAYTLYLDLKEKGILGDAGANLLGIITGIQLLYLPLHSKIIAYIIIFFLTIIGERYSITKIIENNFLLKYLDHLGRKKN